MSTVASEVIASQAAESDRFGLASFVPTGAIGIELGVASGSFSAAMVKSGRFSKFYGVDAYADHHNVTEYLRAVERVGLDAPYTLIRTTFDEAIALFPDFYFDFIYIDGYAHTGEQGGAVLRRWFRKLKAGGIFAGHDYDPAWPEVVRAVDSFRDETGMPFAVTRRTEPAEKQDYYASWVMVNVPNTALQTIADPMPDKLQDGDIELLLPLKQRLVRAARLLLGYSIVSLIRHWRSRRT